MEDHVTVTMMVNGKEYALGVRREDFITSGVQYEQAVRALFRIVEVSFNNLSDGREPYYGLRHLKED